MKKKNIFLSLILCLFAFTTVFLGGCMGFSVVDPDAPSEGAGPVVESPVVTTLTLSDVIAFKENNACFDTSHWSGYSLSAQNMLSDDRHTTVEKYNRASKVFVHEELENNVVLAGIYQINSWNFQRLGSTQITYRLGDIVEESNMMGFNVLAAFNEYVNITNVVATKSTTSLWTSYQFINETTIESADDYVQKLELIMNFTTNGKLTDYTGNVYYDGVLVSSGTISNSDAEVVKPSWFDYVNYKHIELGEDEINTLLDSGILYDISHWNGYEREDVHGTSYKEYTLFNTNFPGKYLYDRYYYTDNDTDYTYRAYKRDKHSEDLYTIKYEESGEGIIYDKTYDGEYSDIADMTKLITHRELNMDNVVMDMSFESDGSYMYRLYETNYGSENSISWTFSNDGILEKYGYVINGGTPMIAYHYTVSNSSRWILDPEWFDINNYQERELNSSEIDELFADGVLFDTEHWTGFDYYEIVYDSGSVYSSIHRKYSEETHNRLDEEQCGEDIAYRYYSDDQIHTLFYENGTIPQYSVEENDEDWEDANYLPSTTLKGFNIISVTDLYRGSSYYIVATKNGITYNFTWMMDLEGIDCVVVDAEKSGSKIRYFNISNIKGAGSVSAPSWLPVEKEMISDDEKNEVLRAFNYDSSNWEGYKRIEKTYDENGELSETVVTYYSDSTKNMVQQKDNMLDGSTTDIFFEFAGLIAYSAYYEDGLSDPELDISNVEDWVKTPEKYVIQEEFTTEEWRLDEWGEKRFKITYVHESKVFYSYIIQHTGTTYSNLCRTHCVTVDSEGELISCEYVEFYRSGRQLTKSVTMFNYTGDVEIPDWVDNYFKIPT